MTMDSRQQCHPASLGQRKALNSVSALGIFIRFVSQVFPFVLVQATITNSHRLGG